MAGAFFRKTEPESFSGGSRPSRPKVGVALGAGAARGWAHIGALQELVAMGLSPDIVVGSSIGAVVGGCFAAGRLDTLESFARSLTKRRVFGLLDVSFNGGGLIGGDRLRARLEESIGALRIEDLPIRYAGVATEIGSGHEIWLKRGPLVDAMRASYALPGVFEPVRIAGRWLFDGAIVNPVPGQRRARARRRSRHRAQHRHRRIGPRNGDPGHARRRRERRSSRRRPPKTRAPA